MEHRRRALSVRPDGGSGTDKKSPTLLFLIESAEQFDHFFRWVPAARRAGYRVVFITARWSDAVQARRYGIECRLVGYSGPARTETDLSGVGELYDGTFTATQAQRYAEAFVTDAEQVMQRASSGLALMWGGGDTVASRAVRAAAQRCGWRVLFIDRGNLPGTLIADPMGMNFDSYLFHHASLLDRESDLSSISRMRTELTHRRNDTNRHSTKRRNWLIGADWCVSMLRGMPFRGRIIPSRRRNTLEGRIAETILSDSRIVLMPVNHSFEVQKVQGGFGFLREQMAEAQRAAAKRSLPVVVTLHPLEHNEELFQTLAELREEYRFTIHPGPSSALLMQTDTVVASNTSVALEALVLGIPVVHVGRTMFRGLDERRLSAYLTHYLLPIEPSGETPVTDDQFARIMERGDWQ
ncbi:MAG: hypothetical protein HUU02_04610 [Bacteroidetes bacterium]|nr:hypothetical protein [Bacteroidota bacterium]